MLSCSKKTEFQNIDVKSQSQNLSLPSNLILQLVKRFKETHPDIKLTEQEVLNKFGFYSKEVWPIEVKLWSKVPETAKSYSVFEASARIDLNSLISTLEESSKFNMQIKIKTPKLNKLFVYFVPSLKNEKNKCSEFYEISSFYQEKLSKLVVLSKKNNHYLKNYIGTYVFFSPIKSDVYQLNVLQLTDSSQGDKLCSYL